MHVYEAKLSYEKTEIEVGTRTLNAPEHVYDYMRDVLDVHAMQEVFYVIFLNQKNRPLGRIAVTQGTVAGTIVHPREVFRPAILAAASGVICVHNHPSGDPTPSHADIQVTRRLREAAHAIEIPLIDHIVIGHKECDPANVGWYSFRSAGLL